MPSGSSLHVGAHVRGQLEDLVGAGRGHNRVGGGDGGNDVLRDTLGVLVRHALYAVLLRAAKGRLVEPLHVLGLVAVELRLLAKRLDAIPFQLLGPFYAVSWGSGDVGQGAHRKVYLWRENGEDAFKAGSDSWDYHIDMPCHALRPSINL